MGMIMAGITEGLGNGITAVAHNNAAIEAALAKTQQAKEIQEMKAQMATYSDNRLKGVEGRITAMGAGGGKGGEADPDIQTPERARMLAAMDLHIGGDQAAQLEEYASTGKAPTIQQQYLAAVQQKDKFDADPSAQGVDASGNTVDYSDATTRRLQHDGGATQVYGTRTVVDPAFSDFYAKNAGAAANSYRKSFQPKEFKSLAEGDSEKQKQGLINSVMNGGPDSTRAGPALTLANGDPIYTSTGVDAVNSSGGSLAKPQPNAKKTMKNPVDAPVVPVAAAPATAKMSAENVASSIARAKAAIAAGYSRAAVLGRLREHNIDTDGL